MLDDLRFALRLLAKSPGFTLIAILTLALGIGANTAIFSVVDAALLRPLPYKNPERLAMVWLDNRRLQLNQDLMSYPIVEDWRKNQVFDVMAPFTGGETILTEGAEPERLISATVSAEFFEALGVPALHGRVFTRDDIAQDRGKQVVLSHGLWTRRFGADPAIIGRPIKLGNESHTVAGIMPPGFAMPDKQTELWSPLMLNPQAKQRRFSFFLSVIARAKPGVPWDTVRAEMSTIGGHLEKQYPEMDGYGVYVNPLRDHLTGRVRTALYIVMGAVGFVLLIACANVANLLLARAASREREIAVRSALGAARSRIARQLLTESVVLAVAGGIAGVVFAQWATDAILALAPANLPGRDAVHLNLAVLGFMLAVAVATGILFGLAPSINASRVDLNESLKEGGRGQTAGTGRRVTSVLMAAEIALAAVLATGAGLLIRSFSTLTGLDPGYRTAGILTVDVAVPPYAAEQRPQVIALFDRLRQRIGALPGVQSTGGIGAFLLSATPNSGSFSIEGRPPEPPAQRIEATMDAVTAGFFETAGVQLKRGRLFNDSDGPDAPPAILINETFAARYWPNDDPVGKRFTFGDPRPDTRWLTIVGVVGDMKRQGFDREARCETFLPHTQVPRRRMTMLVRTAGDPAAIAGGVRAAIREVSKDAPIMRVEPLADRIGETLAARRFQMALLMAFSALALVLAATGVYGVMQYLVTQRTQEIGVRMALGARPADVLRMVLRHGGATALAGIAVGLVASAALARLLAGVLYGVRPFDPITYAGVAALLIASAAAACAIPAWRASRVDPMSALRHE